MGKIEHLDEFNFLIGFRIVDVYESEVTEKDEIGRDVCGGFATIMKFANDKNVGVDVDIVNGEVKISEPYAITDEGFPVKKSELSYK